MIHVIATIELTPGSRASFLQEFHRIVPLVHAEEGCLEYGPSIDMPSGLGAQPPVRSDTVVVVEKWESLEALHAHTQAAHMANYRQRVKDYVVSVTLQVLQPA